jgi:Secretion system C-terminal sorting domain
MPQEADSVPRPPPGGSTFYWSTWSPTNGVCFQETDYENMFVPFSFIGFSSMVLGLQDGDYFEYWMDGGNELFNIFDTEDVPISNPGGSGNFASLNWEGDIRSREGDLFGWRNIFYLSDEEPLDDQEATTGDLIYLVAYDAPNLATATQLCAGVTFPPIDEGFGLYPIMDSGFLEEIEYIPFLDDSRTMEASFVWSDWTPILSQTTLVSPIDDVIVESANIVLTWNGIAEEIEGYEVWLSTAGSELEYICDVTEGFTHTIPLLTTTTSNDFEWFIRPFNGIPEPPMPESGDIVANRNYFTGNQRDIPEFRVYPPGTPQTGTFSVFNPATLVAPGNGSTIPPFDVTLDWDHDGENTDGYEIWFGEIYEADNVSQIDVIPVYAGTEYDLGDLDSLTDYEWYILPYNESGSHTMYVPWTFTTGANTQVISGTVTEDGVGLAGVTITYTEVSEALRSGDKQNNVAQPTGNSRAFTTTGVDGTYSFTATNGTEYIVIPAMTDYSFYPELWQGTVNCADIVDADFGASYLVVLPIPPGAGTVTFPSGGSITLPPGQPAGSTVALVVVPDPPVNIPAADPLPLTWSFQVTGTIAYPVHLRLEWPLDPAITASGFAVMHYTDGVWYSLINNNPTAAHATNLVNQSAIMTSMTYDFSTDPSWIEFDSWTMSDWGADGGDAPLPVTLSSFSAQQISENAVLSWTTYSEVENLGWNIYRSDTESMNEAVIINAEGYIEGAGTTNQQTDYTYTDENELIVPATYWYWLESVSLFGDVALFGPTILETLEDDPGNNTTPVHIDYGLHRNFPNPFNPDTAISFMLESEGKVKLSIYDIKGRKVTTLLDNVLIAEDHLTKVVWNGTNSNGENVSSGIYFYKLFDGTKTETRRMLLLK